jgi:hypothetical protein
MRETIVPERGNTKSVMEMPSKKLPTSTRVWVVLAWLLCLAPIYWEVMLAPAWEKAWRAVKMVAMMGINAPTPAAAVSDVRERNQLSIMGWKIPTAKVRISGQERLIRERSLTCFPVMGPILAIWRAFR